MLHDYILKIPFTILSIVSELTEFLVNESVIYLLVIPVEAFSVLSQRGKPIRNVSSTKKKALNPTQNVKTHTCER